MSASTPNSARSRKTKTVDPSSPWLDLKAAAKYGGGRGPRFLSREVKAGRLRAARIGGRGELVFRREWIDQWLESLSTPVEVSFRRRA